MTHLHLSGYRLLLAKYMLLRASQTLDARPAEEAEEQAALPAYYHQHGVTMQVFCGGKADNLAAMYPSIQGLQIMSLSLYHVPSRGEPLRRAR